jgi:hypothetical protein
LKKIQNKEGYGKIRNPASRGNYNNTSMSGKLDDEIHVIRIFIRRWWFYYRSADYNWKEIKLMALYNFWVINNRIEAEIRKSEAADL